MTPLDFFVIGMLAALELSLWWRRQRAKAEMWSTYRAYLADLPTRPRVGA